MTTPIQKVLRFIKNKGPKLLSHYITKIESSPLGYRMARSTFWALFAAVASRGLNLIVFIVVARLVDREGFGELGIIQSTIGMFGMIAGFGMGMTATKHTAELKVSDPARAGKIIALSYVVAFITGGLMSFFLFVFSGPIATRTLSAPHLGSLLEIGAILLFLSTINGVQSASLAGFEAFRPIARVNLACGIISIPVIILLTFVGNVSGAVWGLCVIMAIQLILNHKALVIENRKFHIVINLKGLNTLWKVLLSFSLPAFCSGLLVTPVNWVCNTLLVRNPNGYEEMGLYNAANQWFSAILFLPGILGQALFPVLTEQISQNNKPQAKYIVLISIKLTLAIVGPMVLFFAFASSWIMRLYGKSFSAAWPVLLISVITAGLIAVQAPAGNVIAASGRMWLGFCMNLGWAIAFILATAFLFHENALQLALARGLAYVIHATWTFAFIFYYLRHENAWKNK